MPELQRLRADHGPALLAFERENRAWFALTISDRGDAFFDHFDDMLRARLAEQAEGICFFHVLVGEEGEILGRINLVDAHEGAAELGYRIARSASRRGLATAGVRELCGRAAREYGLRTLRAVTTVDNTGSRTVLDRAGFTLVGERVVAGRPGLDFVRHLRGGAGDGRRNGY